VRRRRSCGEYAAADHPVRGGSVSKAGRSAMGMVMSRVLVIVDGFARGLLGGP